MSTDESNEGQSVTYDNIISFIRSHEEPVVTASDVADEFNITNQAANYRLRQLEKEDSIRQKIVGASAKVWYLKG